jgi:hypothetical protein
MRIEGVYRGSGLKRGDFIGAARGTKHERTVVSREGTFGQQG